MENQSHAHAHAHGAHTREGANYDLSPAYIFDFFEAWRKLEEQIADLQDRKKAMMQAVKSKHGRHNANALKITMRRAMMDAKERKEEAIFNEMASHYMDLLEGEIEAREHDF